MALSAQQISLLNQSDRTTIQNCMSDLHTSWANGTWFPTRNRYLRDCISQINKDSRQGRRLTYLHLREYIAASVIVHCFDGWSFLGRALEAELAGDPDSARHLGYYAELRAAMSLLASEGIGVFKNKHIVVERNGRCHFFDGPGTHQFVWDALEYWASNQKGLRTIFHVIRPQGIPLREWLYHFSAGVQFIARDWLIKWGLDLKRLADDRETRNIASYRPTAFTSAGPRTITDSLESIIQLWRLCEPSVSERFPLLDKHLLRQSIELTFSKSRSDRRTRHQARNLYARQIDMMLHNLSLSDNARETWRTFLNDESELTPELLKDAAGNAGSNHPDHSRQVLARAFLLLRLSTGSAQELLKNVQAEYLEFWWSSDAVCRRLWDTQNSHPSTFTDLWADVEEAIDELQNRTNRTDSISSHYVLWRENAVSAALLSTTERIALWGLGL